MVDFDALLFGPVHDALSTTALITPTTSASPAEVQVIDKTSGVMLPPGRSGGIGGRFDAPEIATVVPGAVVRVSALTAAGLARADMRGASLTMNGRVYLIDSAQPRPTPGGEADGELLLVLMEA